MKNKQCYNCSNEKQSDFEKEGFCDWCGDLCDNCIDGHEDYTCEYEKMKGTMIAMREDRDAR